MNSPTAISAQISNSVAPDSHSTPLVINNPWQTSLLTPMSSSTSLENTTKPEHWKIFPNFPSSITRSIPPSSRPTSTCPGPSPNSARKCKSITSFTYPVPPPTPTRLPNGPAPNTRERKPSSKHIHGPPSSVPLKCLDTRTNSLIGSLEWPSVIPLFLSSMGDTPSPNQCGSTMSHAPSTVLSTLPKCSRDDASIASGRKITRMPNSPVSFMISPDKNRPFRIFPRKSSSMEPISLNSRETQ
mmetsp:Transcript_13844/g.28231  ORF Transcript_13844/g.28231 Transcript_13844/m.28231 type:complete len:242 (-) Transcript_13844:612-1337(-)